MDTKSHPGEGQGLDAGLRQHDKVVTWRFDFNIIEEMLLSFREMAIKPQPNTDFVKAERSSHLALPLSDKVHLLKNAGHWVHSDNPSGLLDLMASSLKSE
ncbi:MAG: hypothetical protein JKY15_04625 [Deltaproteobacteria bacterium]|nr:hypothetical protein [Deltaproteobacteria bacterium]